MTKTTKTVNFTDAQTAEVVAIYTAAKTDEGRTAAVAKLATQFDKTVPSIRGKLVAEGAYVAKAKATKAAAGEGNPLKTACESSSSVSTLNRASLNTTHTTNNAAMTHNRRG